jgi:hypothetical protein
VQIASAVKALLDQVQKQLPAGVTVANWYDQSQLVTASAASVRDAMLIGAGLAVQRAAYRRKAAAGGAGRGRPEPDAPDRDDDPRGHSDAAAIGIRIRPGLCDAAAARPSRSSRV